MHSDLGGFAGKMKTMNCMLVGCNICFQPIYRPHADENVPSEPV